MLIRMEVVEFTSKHRPAHRGWNRPEVAEGTTLYAIEYSKGGYFTYSYRSREAAEYVKRTIIAEGQDTDQYYGFNVVGDVHRTITSGLGGELMAKPFGASRPPYRSVALRRVR